MLHSTDGTQARNVPFGSNQSVPFDESVHSIKGVPKSYIRWKEIETAAIEKFRKHKQGICSQDLIAWGLARDKKKAKRTIKHFLGKKFLFTVKRQLPQRYFPAS